MGPGKVVELSNEFEPGGQGYVIVGERETLGQMSEGK